MMELSYRRHRFPPVVIRHAVWFYLRFTLSYRDVEDLLAERGFDVSYETVRSWVLKFAARKAARSRAVDRYRRTRGRARLAVRRASPGRADLRRIAGPRRRSPKPHLHHDCGARRALRRSPCACPRGKGRRCRSRTHRAPLGRSRREGAAADRRSQRHPRLPREVQPLRDHEDATAHPHRAWPRRRPTSGHLSLAHGADEPVMLMLEETLALPAALALAALLALVRLAISRIFRRLGSTAFGRISPEGTAHRRCTH
jgi:hypothetical protein